MANDHKIPGPAIAVGVAAAAAAAAGGAYWLYGSKHSAQHRKLAKSWMLKARAEVMDSISKLEDIDKERYLGIVEDVLGKYAAGASTQELASAMKDFKAAWSHMQGTKKGGRSGRGSTRASAKKGRSGRGSTRTSKK